MTDNVTTQSGISVSIPDNTTIATDNIGGVNYQRIKATWGADGTATDVSTAAPFPVTQTSTWDVNAIQSGTWNVGTVSSLTTGSVAAAQSGSWSVAVTSSTAVRGAVHAIQSGTWNIGTVSALTTGSVAAAQSGTWNIGTVTSISSATVTQNSTWDVRAAQSGTWNIGTVTSISSATVTQNSTWDVRAAQSGTWNIGTVSALTTGSVAAAQSGTWNVGVTSITSSTALIGAVNVAQINGVTALMGNGATGTGSPRVTVASDNTPFQVSASNETGSIYSGTTALTPLFATITTSSSGATTVCTAVTSKKIRVVAMQLVANAAVNVKWVSAASTTDKTGLAYLAANGGYVLPYNPVGWFETVSGEALNINLSASSAVGGSLTFITV